MAILQPSVDPPDAIAVLSECIYTIIHPDRLYDAAVHGVPIEENREWKKGEQLWRRAQSEGRSLVIIFADARSVGELLYWATIAKIELDERKTRCWLDEVHDISSGETVQDLRLASTGAFIAEGYIRSYAICQTPDFIVLDPVIWGADVADELIGLEGMSLETMVTHRYRERRLREAKVTDVLRKTGALKCEVPGCGFDFREAYGALGEGYAQVHHLAALAESGITATSLVDLAIVCANCHAMIHRGGGTRPLGAVRPTIVPSR